MTTGARVRRLTRRAPQWRFTVLSGKAATDLQLDVAAFLPIGARLERAGTNKFTVAHRQRPVAGRGEQRDVSGRAARRARVDDASTPASSIRRSDTMTPIMLGTTTVAAAASNDTLSIIDESNSIDGLALFFFTLFVFVFSANSTMPVKSANNTPWSVTAFSSSSSWRSSFFHDQQKQGNRHPLQRSKSSSRFFTFFISLCSLLVSFFF